LTGGVEDVLTLQQLIRARMDERGWTYADLERRSEERLTKGRWQQLGSGARQKSFPEPASVRIMADVLEVDVTTVILSAAQSLGLDARRRGPDLAQLLPTGTDRLSERMRDAILTIIRAAVAETLSRADEDDEQVGRSGGGDLTLEWAKADAPSRRNNVSTNVEDRA
jgi:hypothetical protein